MFNKKKMSVLISLLLSSILINGCFPKRVVWNNSGEYAAVLGDEGEFYITDSEGNLTEKLYDLVLRVEWFDDNQSMLLVKQKCFDNWSQVEKLIPKETQDKIKEDAQKLYGGNVITEWKPNSGLFANNDNIKDAVKIYIRDVAPEMVSKDILNAWKEVSVQVYCIEICSWKNNKFNPEKELYYTLKLIWDLRISPDNKKFLFTSSNDPDETITLAAFDIETNNMLVIDEMVSIYPDWSTDSISAVYAKIEGDDYESSGLDDMTIGSLYSAKICNDNGQLLSKVNKHFQHLNLAINGFARVRCLHDGRIIFSSMEITLPGYTDDYSEQPQLYMIEPKKHKSIIPLITKQSFYEITGYDLNFFEVSPDNKYISFIDHDSRVAVLEISSGDITIMQSESLGDITSIPTWRGPNELCYFSENEDGDFAALHKPGNPPANISIGWPEDVKEAVFK